MHLVGELGFVESVVAWGGCGISAEEAGLGQPLFLR